MNAVTREQEAGPTTSATKPGPLSREVRLGLVMYGGVSLAIYMNGVANELFRASRGRGVYKLFKKLTDSEIVIDVVSGASAGGINGIFLGYALCNGLEFGTSAALWREHGDVMKLLRAVNDAPESHTSLFDSEGYYRPKLADAFQAMWRDQIREDTLPEETRDMPAPIKELDLFVTGTHFDGRLWNQTDAAGHSISVKEHRTLFWLKHRANRKCQLHPGAAPNGAPPGNGAPTADEQAAGFQAFAKLAQITSCFPAAFAPVKVTVGDAARDDELVDRKLALWGKLRAGTHYFLDGGILDNKPFTSTIRTIFYRFADRPVQRHLLYVEPDPERFQAVERGKPPNFFQCALDSLTRLPSYESIAQDLQLIAEHNDRVERYKRMCSLLRETVMQNGAATTTGPAHDVYVRARFDALGEAVIARVVKCEGEEADPGAARSELLERKLQKQRTEEQAAALRKSFDEVLRTNQGEIRKELFDKFDVYYRLRQLMHLTYVLVPDAEAARVPIPGDLLTADDRQSALERIGRYSQLLEIVQAALERTLEGNVQWLGLDAQEVLERAWHGLRRVLNAATLPSALRTAIARGELEDAHLEATKRWLDAKRADEDRERPGEETKRRAELTAPEQELESLLELIDAGTRRVVGGYEVRPDRRRAAQNPERPVQHEYDRYEQLDALLFPMQLLAGMHERDVIRTVRVSPADAQRGICDRKLADKVCGDALGHFGAFLKGSWRSNDILWGRLDGACQLLETLLNDDWLDRTLGRTEEPPADPAAEAAPARAVDDPRIRVLEGFGVVGDLSYRARRAGIRHWLDSSAIFPQAGAEAVDRVAEALAVMLGPGVAKPSRHAKELLDAVVQATHFDILAESLGDVVQDAVQEQLKWQQTPKQRESAPGAVTSRFDLETLSFDGPLDALVAGAAARKFAGDAIQSGTLRGLPAYFKDYRVGSESVENDIPRTVLLEAAAHTSVVLRNCLLNSLSERRADTVQQSPSYRWLLDRPHRVVHALTVSFGRSPRRARDFFVVSIVYFLIAAVLNGTLASALYRQDGVQRLVAIFALIVLPLCLVGLAFSAIVPRNEQPEDRAPGPLRRLVRAGGRLVLTLSSACVLIGIYVALALGAEPALCTDLNAGGPVCEGAAHVAALLLVTIAGFALGSLERTRRARPRARREQAAWWQRRDPSAQPRAV